MQSHKTKTHAWHLIKKAVLLLYQICTRKNMRILFKKSYFLKYTFLGQPLQLNGKSCTKLFHVTLFVKKYQPGIMHSLSNVQKRKISKFLLISIATHVVICCIKRFGKNYQNTNSYFFFLITISAIKMNYIFDQKFPIN